MTQEQINQLRQEVPMIARQIEILNGPEFADTVPQIATAIEALENYKNEASRIVSEWDAAHAPAQPVMPAVRPGILNLDSLYGQPAPAANPFGQINMQALGQLVAALQQAAPALGNIDVNALRSNPIFQALLQAVQDLLQPVQAQPQV